MSDRIDPSVASKLLEWIAAKQLFCTKKSLLCCHGFNLHTGLVTDCRAQSVVRYSSRHRYLWSLCAGAIRFICSLWHVIPPHSGSLQRLEHSYGITRLVRQWFQSYLVSRRQFVRTGSTTSSLSLILCGVPQGSLDRSCSCYTLLTATAYWWPRFLPSSAADDIQVYGLCRPSITLDLQNSMSSCIDDVARWMRSNRLQLNTAKTEVQRPRFSVYIQSTPPSATVMKFALRSTSSAVSSTRQPRSWSQRESFSDLVPSGVFFQI